MPKLTLNDFTNLSNESSVVAQLNANNALIEGAFENTVSRDGSTPNHWLADQDANGQRILNLPDAVNAQEPAAYGQLLTAATDGAFTFVQ